jgi:hypothetical protein
MATGSAAKPEQSASDPPDDPVTPRGTIILGIYFFCLAALTFYFLVATWPVLDPDHSGHYSNFTVFWWTPAATLSTDLRLFVTVVVSGALGSLIHCVTSFADYVGNRRLSRSWVWWLILRTPIGIALALLFYLVLRGGLIVPSLPGGETNEHPAAVLNPYGLAAIAAMAGMFSKQATDKLREIFDTLFRTSEPVERADPLAQAIPVISSAEPAKLKVGGSTDIALVGYNFHPNCTASVNGKDRNAKWISTTRLALTLLPEDVSAKGELRVKVHSPDARGGDSPEFTIPVED